MVPVVPYEMRAIGQIADSYDMVMFRRFMLKTAARLARRNSCLGLVTGDSLGQVASQTLHNLGAISSDVSLPILRPLIGMDKMEITAWSERIGAFATSQEPLPVLAGDSVTIVPDRCLQQVRLAVHGHLDLVVAVFVGVLEQVAEQLEQVPLVGPQQQAGIDIQFALYGAVAVYLVQPADQAPYDRGQLDRRGDTVAAGHSRALALVTDDLVDAFGLFDQQPAAFRIGVVLGGTAQHRERRLHTVSEVGEAVADAFLAALVLLKQGVEVAAQTL